MRARVEIDAMREGDIPAVVAMGGAPALDAVQLREEFARSWSRRWVAREEGQGVVAFVLAWHVADELHVLNVTTRVDRRRRGVAWQLMSAVVKYGRENRLRHVLLEVRRSNAPAIALYRRTGFYATHVRPRYYADDEDAVEMMLAYDPETGGVLGHADEVVLDTPLQ